MKKQSCLGTLRLCFVFVLLAGLSTVLKADVRLPEIFSSDMVLQRAMKVPVWGWADAGEKVSVSFEGQEKKTEAGADGRWMIELDPLQPGGPFSMTVKGNNELNLQNVLVGDVWLCSGQSNMEWNMNASADSRAEIPSVNNPNIRLFHIPKSWMQRPQTKLNASWKACNPENITPFSAVGYYFGKKLNEDLNIPIGLINASWGGTRIEPWTPPVGFQSLSTLSNISEEIEAKDPTTELHKKLVDKAVADQTAWIEKTKKNLADSQPFEMPPAVPTLLTPYSNHQQATVLYNAMLNPFVPLAMKGGIWYQGESNRGEGMLYAEKMKALILGWRNVFRNPDLGFYYVQLAPYDYKNNPQALAEIWEAQASVEKEIPKTGMAVINDIGNLKDIHPDKKSIVGYRLALLALNRSYGKTDITAASPELDKMNIDGNRVVLTFKNAKKLKTRDGNAPNWFEIAGADGVFHKANAVIDGTLIRLTNSEVEKPFAVRFAWDMLAEPNVQNEAGLQLGAFRVGEIPERGVFDTLVPEGKNFRLVYSFDPTKPTLADNRHRFEYRTDKSAEIAGKIKRVGYFMSLKPKTGESQYVFVSMPPLDPNIKKLGVPTKGSGARFQKNVNDVMVKSNVAGVENGTFAEGCNVEFWDCNYGPQNSTSVPGASAEKYDFGDEMSTATSPGYGSMQVHHFAKKHTIFAFNNFGGGGICDVGIGNCSGKQPDWTFSNSAKDYDGGQFMIFVETE